MAVRPVPQTYPRECTMKMPGYIKVKKITPGPGEFEVSIWVRFLPQHIDTAKALWKGLTVHPAILKPFVLLWAWWRVCQGVRA